MKPLFREACIRNDNEIHLSRREFIKESTKAAIGVAVITIMPLSNTGCPMKREAEDAADKYYISRKSKLLSKYKKTLKPLRPVFLPRFGSDLTDTILEEVLKEYEALTPDLPYIGGDENMMTEFLIESAHCLAIYRVLKPRGKTVEDIGEIIYEMIEARLAEVPAFILYLYGLFKYNRFYEKRLKEQAEKSQERRYAGDFVFNFIEGKGEEFDYGLDITECGICEFYKAQDAVELTPYVCLIDFPLSKAFNRGLVRTMTIAEGAEKCDFRFKKGRKTKEGWPPEFLRRG